MLPLRRFGTRMLAFNLPMNFGCLQDASIAYVSDHSTKKSTSAIRSMPCPNYHLKVSRSVFSNLNETGIEANGNMDYSHMMRVSSREVLLQLYENGVCPQIRMNRWIR